MQKYLLLILLIPSVAFSQAQQLELKKGTVLNFAVSDMKSVYDYFVTITAIDSTHLSFDWKMVSGNSKKGSAEISSASLDSATSLLFKIETIKKLTIPNISLLLSRQQFQKLKKGKCLISSDASMRGIPVEKTGAGPDAVNIDDTPVMVPQVFGSGERTDGKIWVWDNPVFPLVIGYEGPTLTYTLMNVNTPK